MEKDVAADAAAQKEEEEQLAKLGEDMGTCLFSEYRVRLKACWRCFNIAQSKEHSSASMT